MRTSTTLLGTATLLLLGAPFAGHAQIKLFDNFNKAACSYTDSATFDLRDHDHVGRIALWYNWNAGERSLPYSLSLRNQVMRNGTLVRSSCDSYQSSWCLAQDTLNQDLPAGEYTVRVTERRVCQNAGSGGRGFVTVDGHGIPTAPTPKPQPMPTTAAKDPCAGKPRTNNPFDECNTVTVTQAVSTNTNSGLKLPPPKETEPSPATPNTRGGSSKSVPSSGPAPSVGVAGTVSEWVGGAPGVSPRRQSPGGGPLQQPVRVRGVRHAALRQRRRRYLHKRPGRLYGHRSGRLIRHRSLEAVLHSPSRHRHQNARRV